MSEREFVLQLDDQQVAALVEIMFLAAEADGEIQMDELAELAQHIERVTNGAVDHTKAMILTERASAALATSNREARLKELKAALTPPQRKHALMLAIQVTAADGRIRTSERELILEIAETLEIDGDTAADLVSAVTAH